MRERHAECGGRILRQWQLPQAIEDPVVAKRLNITESWLEALDQRAPELFENARQIVS